MEELWRLSAAQLAEGYRTGAFTPIDALDAVLARIEQWQPHINAMAMVDAAGARQAAGASRLRWARHKQRSPLDGVPISLKDNLNAGGLHTTWGSRLLKDFVAHKDELPVARLRAAGAVLFGKTNLPEFAMQGTTSNRVTGITRNPWNPALTPGGSSGGAAAAVASGCGPLALATDGGGSIRRPASHTGLVGFKPSIGLVPRQDGLPEIFLDYEVAGGIGRTVQDVQLLATVLASPGPGLDPAEFTHAHILYVPGFAGHPVDPAIAAQVREVAGRLQALGHTVEEGPPFGLAEEVNALWPVLSATGLAWMLGDASVHPEFRLQPGQLPDIAQCSDATQRILGEGLAAEGATLFELLHAIRTLNVALEDLFLRHDFILTPATAALPWPVEQTHPALIDGREAGPRGHAVFTPFANAAGLPAIALPSGFVDGLPAGFQLVGAPGSDAALLEMAANYEEAHPWAAHWPELPATPAAQP